jgi:hypothetical protein
MLIPGNRGMLAGAEAPVMGNKSKQSSLTLIRSKQIKDNAKEVIIQSKEAE